MKKPIIHLIIIFLTLSTAVLESCRKRDPEPQEEEIPEIEDDPEEEEEDDDDGNAINSPARQATIPKENALIVRFTPSNPCNAGSSLRIFYREAASMSTVPITYAQRRADPAGTWKSFRFTPERFNKIMGKTFDRTKSYALYAYDTETKTLYPQIFIGSFPAEIVVQEVPSRKAYSTAIVPISCNK